MRKKIDLIILFIVIIIGIVGILNAREIGDWWHLVRYDPPEEIVQLSINSGMSEEGQKLFYRFSPKIVQKSELDNLCSVDQLGCVEGNSMYILKANNQEEENRSSVTAAHEMLHIVYSRLSGEEIENIEELIDEQLKTANASYLIKKLEKYPNEDYYNEAHSMIGSEVKKIIPELETHYSKYFTDRLKTTNEYFNSPERLLN